MQRARRKRKLSENSNSYPEQDECDLMTEIKIETEDNLPPPPACCLCGVSSGGRLSALFDDDSKNADPTTVDKIRMYIGRKVCHQKLNIIGINYDSNITF